MHRHSSRQIDLKEKVKLAISLAYFCLDGAYRTVLRLLGRTVPPRFTILYYHAVPDAEREAFAAQMNILDKRARVIPAGYRGPLEEDRVHVAITFDDAFVSVAANALPELIARSFTATIFVPSGQLGRHPAWEMEDGATDRGELIMTAEELRKLPAARITLGAHSVTHPQLAKVDRAQARREIQEARAQLERLTERPVDLFAFPYGSYDDAVVEMCREAGYAHAYTVVPQAIDPLNLGILRGRTRVLASDGPLQFFLKAHGAYNWMPKASSLKRKLRSVMFASAPRTAS